MRTVPALDRPVLAGLFALIARVGIVVERWEHAHENRKAAKELATLDRRMLADIGLDLGDVMAALERPVDQDPTLHLARLVQGRRLAASAQRREAKTNWATR